MADRFGAARKHVGRHGPARRGQQRQGRQEQDPPAPDQEVGAGEQEREHVLDTEVGEKIGLPVLPPEQAEPERYARADDAERHQPVHAPEDNPSCGADSHAGIWTAVCVGFAADLAPGYSFLRSASVRSRAFLVSSMNSSMFALVQISGGETSMVSRVARMTRPMLKQ